MSDGTMGQQEMSLAELVGSLKIHSMHRIKKEYVALLALNAEVERLKRNMQWYVDYANGQDKRVSREIARCNKAEAERDEAIKALSVEITARAEAEAENKILTDEIKELKWCLRT